MATLAADVQAVRYRSSRPRETLTTRACTQAATTRIHERIIEAQLPTLVARSTFSRARVRTVGVASAVAGLARAPDQKSRDSNRSAAQTTTSFLLPYSSMVHHPVHQVH